MVLLIVNVTVKKIIVLLIVNVTAKCGTTVKLFFY